MKKNNLCLWIAFFSILAILSLNVVMAVDFDPAADINMKGRWAMKNATNISVGPANNVYINKSGVFGNVFWAYLQNIPSYVKDWSSTITGNMTQAYSAISGNRTEIETNTNNMISGNKTEIYTTLTNNVSNLNSAITGNASALRIDIEGNYTALNNLKLNKTDQRYNDTELILSVNTTAKDYTDAMNLSIFNWAGNTFLKIVDMFSKQNIVDMISGNRTEIESNTNSAIAGNMSLANSAIVGNTSALNGAITGNMSLVNSAITGNISAVRNDINNNYTALDNLKLNKSDQRYNDTALILNVNTSAHNYTDSKLITTIYNASTIQTIIGTPQGVIGDIRSYNNIGYNVSESSSDIDFRVNFTGISSLNQIIVRYKSDPAESHTMDIALWDTAIGAWESYRTVGASPDWNIMTMNVYDQEDHIVNGVVQMRFYSVNSGGLTHKHQFDWVAISDGPATPSSSETEPMWTADKPNYWNSTIVNNMLQGNITNVNSAIENNASAPNLHTHDTSNLTNLAGITNKTIVDWNNITSKPIILNGTDGRNGTDGTNGTNGLNGTNGINGTNGLNGTNGIDGTNGTNAYNITNNITTYQMNYTNVALTNQSTSWGLFNLSADWGFMKIAWANLQNIPSYVKDWDYKLNATDQRYNDTANPTFSGLATFGTNNDVGGTPRIKVLGYSDTMPLQEWGDGGIVYTYIGRTTGNIMYMATANNAGNDFEFRNNYKFINQVKFPGSGTWDNSGNVGIGTLTPTAKLHILSPAGSVGNGIALMQADAPTYGYTWRRDDATGNLVMARVEAGASNDYMSIARNTGNVGIGTTTPNTDLDVNGDVEVGTGGRGLELGSSASDNFWLRTFTNTPNPNWNIGIGNGAGGFDGTKYISMNANGYLGVGTSSPSAKLDVAGTVNLHNITFSGGGYMKDNGTALILGHT